MPAGSVELGRLSSRAHLALVKSMVNTTTLASDYMAFLKGKYGQDLKRGSLWSRSRREHQRALAMVTWREAMRTLGIVSLSIVCVVMTQGCANHG